MMRSVNICGKCGTENDTQAKFCRTCGGSLKEPLQQKIVCAVCMKCEHLNPPDAKFCEECGNEIIMGGECKLRSIAISAISEYKRLGQQIVQRSKEANLSKVDMQTLYTESEDLVGRTRKILESCKIETKDKKFIDALDNYLVFLDNELKTVSDMMSSSEGGQFCCIYCKKDIIVKGGIPDKEIDVTCEFCHKKEKVITGTISAIRGRTNAVVQYGPEPIVLTLKLEDGLRNISFKTGCRFLVNKGDRVSLVYKNKLLSKEYSEKPWGIFNLTTGEPYLL